MWRSAETVRGQLRVLAVVTVALFLLFAAAVVFWSSHINVRAHQNGLENTVRALTLAVDGRIERWKAALSALATSPELADSDLSKFYEQAVAVARNEGGWIVVSAPSGQQLLNTLRPYGAELPRALSPDLPQTVLSEPAVHVSDLYVGQVYQRPVLSVTVPVLRQDQVTHAIHLGLTPETLADLLARQRLPTDWIAGIVDGRNRLVARYPHEPDLVGQQMPEWFRRGSADLERGMLRGEALDGRDFYGAFHRLPQAAWILAVAAPAHELRRAWLSSSLVLAGGGLILLGFLSAAIRSLGIRLTRPLDDLAAAARAATRGDALPPIPAPQLREYASLHQAVIELSHTQLLLREANHRIKNSLQIVAAGLGLQSRATGDPEARDSLEEAQAHVQAIARLHERLYRDEAFEDIDAIALAREVCADVALIAATRCAFHIEADGDARVDAKAAGALALIVAELALNSVKHATIDRKGEVTVRVRCADPNTMAVMVVNNGPPLPLDFDLEGQKGMGLRMCVSLAAQLGATLRLVPAGDTTAFELLVPLARGPDAPELQPGSGGAGGGRELDGDRAPQACSA
jgi:two-component sensor histidine kinase